MQPRSRLDELVERFRERWMTDPQYRARMSAVLGVVVLLALCSCMGVFMVAANAVLASGGLGGSSNAQYGRSGGSNPISAGAVIPTDTVPLWTPVTEPAAPPVPASGTPPATPTLPPTPTPAPTAIATSGSGGNGIRIMGPNPWMQCKNATDKCDTVVVQTTPNTSLSVTVTDCAGTLHPTGTTDVPPNKTDGSGKLTYSISQAGATNQSDAVVVVTLFGGGPQTFTLSCG